MGHERNRIPTLSAGFSWRARELSWPLETDVGPGLAGVIAAETRVCWLDPGNGLLSYRGVPIEDLAHGRTFEDVAHLLINGKLPEDDEEGFDLFCASLEGSRNVPPEVTDLVRGIDPTTHPLRILRAAVSAVGCHEMEANDDLAGDRHWQELRIVGQVASLVALIARHRRGLGLQDIDPGESLAFSVLKALTKGEPDSVEVEALNLLWVLYAAHGLDAPTFASLVVASCLADPYTNVVAGISALSGTRVGGAGETVLEQILPLGDGDEARSWVRESLDRGQRIAGFGHRLYRMPDPRVALLRKSAALLARRAGCHRLFEVARAVEEEARGCLAPRGVHVNINFYAALVLHLLGSDPPLVPCLVAVGRMAGVAALVREALGSIRLFRPLSRYVGEAERRLDRGAGG